MSDPLAAAVAIGQALCADAIRHDGRCTWIGSRMEELADGRPQAVFTPLDGSLYDGTAGIALFLAELWRVTGAADHHRTAVAAARHAVERTSAAPSAGLHGGHIGVAWAIRRAGRALGSEDLLGAVPALCALEPDDAETDLLTGLAGSALGLACLGEVPRAVDLCEEIVRRAEWSGTACSWATGRPQDRLAHLLGLGHGASGIALALAEVGAASGRTDLAAAAAAGFAYEHALFDEDRGDWPDLRADPRAAGGPTFMRAWCHGAPGIAIARIRAHEILADPGLRAQALTALRATATAVADAAPADGADFCLCHGLGGNVDVLLSGAAAFPDECAPWLELVAEVIDQGVRRYHDTGEGWPCGRGSGASPSLMTGLAGIGLLLLRCHDSSIETPLAISAALSASPGPNRSQEVTNVL